MQNWICILLGVEWSSGRGKGTNQGRVAQGVREMGAAERIPAGRDLSSRQSAEEAPKNEEKVGDPPCAKRRTRVSSLQSRSPQILPAPSSGSFTPHIQEQDRGNYCCQRKEGGRGSRETESQALPSPLPPQTQGWSSREREGRCKCPLGVATALQYPRKPRDLL